MLLDIILGIFLADTLEVVLSVIFTLVVFGIAYLVGSKKQKREEEERRVRFIKYQQKIDKGEKLTSMEQLDYDLFGDKYLNKK